MTTGDFTTRTDALLDRAAGLCRRRGAQLTKLRRKVLGLVLESDRPMGAYELLDRLRAERKTAAPPTVYRALDFLLEHGLIHKVEKLSAFVGCNHRCDDGEHIEAHAAQFLICTRCGRVAELDDPEVGEALAHAAQRNGFALAAATVEAEGVCSACAG
jgi:Fur family transcriptional regulator, zinc uptake regulator